MSEDTDATADTRDVEEIEEDLAATREELSETIDALASKLDVKTRSRDWARTQTKATQQRATQVKDEHSQEILIGAGVAAAVIVLLVVWRVRR